MAPSAPCQMATNTAAGSAGGFLQLTKGNFPHPVEVSAANQGLCAICSVCLRKTLKSIRLIN